MWTAALYLLRNRIIHEGHLVVSHADAYDGLQACWKAIYLLENAVPSLSVWIVIAPDMGRFAKTAGTLFS